jgi:hypothetical protein
MVVDLLHYINMIIYLEKKKSDTLNTKKNNFNIKYI